MNPKLRSQRLLIVVIVIAAFIFVYSQYYFSLTRTTEMSSGTIVTTQHYRKPVTPSPAASAAALDQGTSTSSVRSGAEQNGSKSYAYLFQGKREAMTSNIVGYFANGAFVWYVPDWLVTNWKMVPYGPQGMVFTPLVRDDPNNFSDISFSVASSTELYNADNLYQTRLDTALKSDLISHEVLLNQHEGDTISMQIETNTRIYHIIDRDADGIHMRDAYYMDGNGKTLVIMFEAKSEIFSQFTDKIRNMVEGIGELKIPQG